MSEIITRKKYFCSLWAIQEYSVYSGKLVSIQDLYTRWCQRKAQTIIKDPNHQSHSVLSVTVRQVVPMQQVQNLQDPEHLLPLSHKTAKQFIQIVKQLTKQLSALALSALTLDTSHTLLLLFIIYSYLSPGICTVHIYLDYLVPLHSESVLGPRVYKPSYHYSLCIYSSCYYFSLCIVGKGCK